MTNCPTCGRRPSERTHTTVGTATGVFGASQPTANFDSCPDPIHDLADRCVELDVERETAICAREFANKMGMDLQARVAELEERLARAISDGSLRRCDIPAHNCNGYHSHYAQRMMEEAEKGDTARAELAVAVGLLREISEQFNGGGLNLLAALDAGDAFLESQEPDHAG